VTDREIAVTPYLNGNADLASRPGSYNDDLPAAGDWAADPAAGLVSFAFLKAAIRRSAAFCCIMTIAGLLIGGILYVALPAPYQAAATLLLRDGPYENGEGSATDDQAIAQSNTLANLAMQRLGLRESASSFVKSYAVTVDSQQVLLVTFTAKSASAAVAGANAVAQELLRFRAGLLIQQQNQVFAALNQQVSQAEAKITSLNTQISQALAQPASPLQQSQLHHLHVQLTNAKGTLTALQQAVTTTQSTIQPATTAAIEGSRVLDAASTLPRSHLKRILIYPVAGLIIGLALALAIVLIRAIVSDRLRRRDDVAIALGASVKLCTGPLFPGRGLSPFKLRRLRAEDKDADIARIAAHLGRAIWENDRGIDGLALVAVDDPEAAALPLVSLATSCARQGKRVVLADLAVGAPAARLLGAASPGVSTVDAQDARLAVAIPERDDVAPSGPLGRVSAWDQYSPFSQAVAGACGSADLLLTLVSLDPSLGGDYLRTWAADAVVIVTAGQSTWTKINTVGEMVRLSGTRLVSAVLVGTDRTDESLGAVPAQSVVRDAEIAANAPASDAAGLTLASEEIGKHRSMT